jgi:hypothetical protein
MVNMGDAAPYDWSRCHGLSGYGESRDFPPGIMPILMVQMTV